VTAFVFALAACAIYLKLDDLWPIVGAHAVIDLLSFW